MPGIKQYSAEEKKRIAQGLLGVVPGSPNSTIAAIDTMGEEGVAAMIGSAKKNIDANLRPLKRPGSFAAMLSGEADASEEDGAKDKIKKYIDRELSGRRLTDRKELQGLESTMAVAGYPMTLDNNLSDQERGFLSSFREQLDKGLTLGSIFSANVEAAQGQERRDLAAADAQAKSQNDLYSKYSAGLVYAGYLKPEDVADRSKAAQALSSMISNTMQPGRQADELRSMFASIDAMEPNQKALDYIKSHTLSNTTGVRLQSDLESNDPARIKLAQGYMALNGVQVAGKDVDINGVIYSKQFVEAAETMIREPIKSPTGRGPGGRPDLQEIYGLTSGGQLHLPQGAFEALSRGDQEAAKAYPESKDAKFGDMTREGFIAARLIADDPKKYEALLTAENEQRKNISLKVDVTAVAQENVLAAVNENEESLDAVQLPPNFAEVATRYAAENGGAIRIEHLPHVLAQAEGKATSLTSGIDYARGNGPRAGLDDNALSQSIKLDPASPDFQKNMEQVLKTAYVLENAQVGVTMDNVSPEILDGFKKVASTQEKITNSLVDGKLETFGLPATYLSHMQNLHTDGRVMAVELANELRVIDPNGAGKRINPANLSGEIVRTDIEGLYGKGNAAIDRIVEADNVVNVKDPAQLAVAIQMGIAMKDGVTLKDVLARPGVEGMTAAVAQGFLGVNVRSPDAVPIQQENRPIQLPEQPKPAESKGWLSSISEYFVGKAEAKDAPQPSAAQRPQSPAVAEPIPGLYGP